MGFVYVDSLHFICVFFMSSCVLTLLGGGYPYTFLFYSPAGPVFNELAPLVGSLTEACFFFFFFPSLAASAVPVGG